MQPSRKMDLGPSHLLHKVWVRGSWARGAEPNPHLILPHSRCSMEWRIYSNSLLMLYLKVMTTPIRRGPNQPQFLPNKISNKFLQTKKSKINPKINLDRMNKSKDKNSNMPSSRGIQRKRTFWVRHSADAASLHIHYHHTNLLVVLGLVYPQCAS